MALSDKHDTEPTEPHHSSSMMNITQTDHFDVKQRERQQ